VLSGKVKKMLRKNIFITGFMGTGKSTVAIALADKMNKKCIDMDILIEKKEGKSITDIFNDEGESYFRKVEREVLKEVIKQNDLVVATGGGTLLNDENYQLARENSAIILLKANPEIIFNRLKEDGERPLLSEKNKLDRIKSLMEERKDQYSRFGYSVDTSNLPVAQVVDEIIKIYRREYDEDNISEI